MFVLDSSVALALLFPDEASEVAETVAARLAASAAMVPTIWPLEVRNALLSAFKSRRITAAELDELLAVIALLPVEIQPPADPAALDRTVALARRTGLSLYDASYLDLARERSIPLATLDQGLRKAAKASKVALLD